MSDNHTVKSYDSDLKKLHDFLGQMGSLVEQQLVCAVDAFTLLDKEKAIQGSSNDSRIDEIEYEIDNFVVRTIALRQPVASDLRHLVAALKISSHLERIADYATNIAKRAQTLIQLNYQLPSKIPDMAHVALQMIKDVLKSYTTLDENLAIEVWKKDADVDKIYMDVLYLLLKQMNDNQSTINPCSHLLFIAKNIERIGDHATNIAELIHFINYGKPFAEPRPKMDESASAIFDLS